MVESRRAATACRVGQSEEQTLTGGALGGGGANAGGAGCVAAAVIELDVADCDVGIDEPLGEDLKDDGFVIVAGFVVHQEDPVVVLYVLDDAVAGNVHSVRRDVFGLAEDEGSAVVGGDEVDEEGEGLGGWSGGEDDGVEFDVEVGVVDGDVELLGEGVTDLGLEEHGVGDGFGCYVAELDQVAAKIQEGVVGIRFEEGDGGLNDKNPTGWILVVTQLWLIFSVPRSQSEQALALLAAQ